MMARTRVYVTVDVECAEERSIGGWLLPAQDYDMRVWGRFRNHRHDLGIGLIMRELEARGFRATFFTEVLELRREQRHLGGHGGGGPTR